MAWSDIRLREAFPLLQGAVDLPFGGLPIAWCGDPGQLPPVGGLSPWCPRTTDNKQITGLALKGYYLWKAIKNVIMLKQIRRQTGWFGQMLLRLRDGKCTKEDWTTLNLKCAQQNLSQERINEFISPNSIWLFNTNADNHKHNAKMIQQLHKPILRINAHHDVAKSKEKTTQFCRNMPPFVFIASGAKVMLWWNLNSKVGLVNGSTGVVKDWLYAEGEKAPSLPESIIIEFTDYTGPPFFSGAGREKWVPLTPETYKWPGYELNAEDHYRKQYPISLAWGLTVWKSQGMTINTILSYNLGDKEPEAGLTYVALSRMTDVNNLYIDKGCSLERLTTTIAKNKKMAVRLCEDVRLENLHAATCIKFDI